MVVNNQKGQSAIEFILTFVFAIGVTFLFVNQAINLTGGYLVHYVNFMSARAYLVHDVGSNVPSEQAAEGKAREVFKSYKLEDFNINASFEVITSEAANALFTGTVMQFEKKLSSIPMVGGGQTANFYSESFLGKEPSRFTCYQMVCAAITGSQGGCNGSTDSDLTLFDNGC